MKLGMPLNYAGDFRETVDKLADFEQAGVDRVMVPEAYSFDAVSQMGYIAAKTQRMELAFGILPMYTRTPTLLAMTAAGIDYISDGRCILGIGASGPQVIEGFHGIRYDAPLGRAREHVQICRQVWARETLNHQGRHYTLPLTAERGGSGLGKALRLINHPVRKRIPMLLAAIGPRNVELAAEMFDEWQPFLFYPEHRDKAFGNALAAGKARRDQTLPPLGIAVQIPLLITVNAHSEASAFDVARHHAALYIGGMGARNRNFYRDLMSRYGYDREAERVQDLFLSGDKTAAAAAVPDALIRATSLIGPTSFVQERISALKEAGTTCIMAGPLAQSHHDRLDQIEQLRTMLD